MTVAPIDPLVRVDDGTLTALRRRLSEVGFSDRTIADAEAIAPRLLDVVRLPLVRFLLARRGDDASTLARLFSYGDVVATAMLERALGGKVVGALLEAGWLQAGAEGARAAIRLTPMDGLWIVSDAFEDGESAVMGPGMTSDLLRRLMPARSPGRVLDVGCGAGTFALIAARRGAAVSVGVDLNPRALALARLNARLNDLVVEFRQGDLLAPVRDDRFDLIVCQPPYVVQPAGVEHTTYLHGGPDGDELALRAIAEIGPALAPGGRALVMFDTAQVPGTSPAVRLRAALGRAPLDLVVLSGSAPSSDLQAIAYASLVAPELGPTFAAAVRQYAEHFEVRRLTHFARLLVVVGRPEEPGPEGGRFTIALPVPNLAAVDDGALGAYLRGIELAGLPDHALSSARVSAHPEAMFIEERASFDGEPKYRLRFARPGLVADQELPEAGWALLQALGPALDVKGAIVAHARLCDAPPAEVGPQVLSFVRHGLSRGFLRG